MSMMCHDKHTICVDKTKPRNSGGNFFFRFDPKGQERFTSMTRLYYREAAACIIMFDVTNASTFSNSQKWKQDLDSKVLLPDGSPMPCLLLANKVSSSGCARCGGGREGDPLRPEPCPELSHSP